MTDDIFADRVAKVRLRFVATLEAKIEETAAALPKLGGVALADTAVAASPKPTAPCTPSSASAVPSAFLEIDHERWISVAACAPDGFLGIVSEIG